MRRKNYPKGKHRIIGIDPGLTKTGVALGRAKGGKLVILKHLIIGAEGKDWYEKCNDIAVRVTEWITDNTSTYDVLHIMIEEPINMMQQRAWSAAIQNRLFSCLIRLLKGIDGRTILITTIIPISMKKMFTGYGRAAKDDIVDRASKIYRFKGNYSKANSEALGDAIAICWCSWKYTKSGVLKVKGVNVL